MVKKVIDILPPKPKSSLTPEKSKESFAELSLSHDEKVIFKSSRQRPSLNIWKKSLAALFALIILVFVSLHFFFAKAEIEIAPKTQPFNFSETVTADINTVSANPEQSLIPGIIFEIEKEVAEEFQATAAILKRAEGKIRIYNNFTTQTETWLKSTRFVSSEGKLFLSKDAIRVPGAALKNGRIEASFVDVPVIAAEGGQEYNIGPSNFSIAAFLGTARYTQYHGESSESMSGGGAFHKVSKEDLDRAEALLMEEAKNESEAELAGKIPDGFVFLKESVRSETLEKSSSAEVDQETDKFEFRIKTKASILSFKLEDLKGIAEHFVVSQLEPGKTFYKEGLRTEYQFQAFNSDELRLLVLLSGSAKIYSELDLNSLKRSLVGKYLSEAKILLNNQEELSRAQIRLFPFWRNSLPSKLEKIEINLVVD